MDRKVNILALLVPLAALLTALPSQALFKVLGPDGKVTYTDRPPSSAQAKVTPMSASGSEVADVSLPLELRQPVSRYPVTLFAMANCGPCDSARTLLRQRGIPHTEKTVLSEEDVEALQRLIGSRDVPALMLGTQPLRGFSPELWNSYLDLAGYPRESRLPADYQYALPTPLTQRRDATRLETTPAPPPQEQARPTATEPSPDPTGIRF